MCSRTYSDGSAHQGAGSRVVIFDWDTTEREVTIGVAAADVARVPSLVLATILNSPNAALGEFAILPSIQSPKLTKPETQLMRPIPAPIFILFCIDFALLAAFVGFGLLLERDVFGPGAIDRLLHGLVDIEAEASICTWFSTIQLFLLAAMLALHAWRHRLGGASFVVWLPALVALLLSLDEIVMLHEWSGRQLDVLLPEGTRRGTVVHFTGLWGVVIGGPVLLVLILMWLGLRRFLVESPRALSKLVLGSVVLVVGAAGMDFVANWTFGRGTWLHAVETIFEEGMELIGVTIMCWGAWDLLMAGRFRLTWNPVLGEES